MHACVCISTAGWGGKGPGRCAEAVRQCTTSWGLKKVCCAAQRWRAHSGCATSNVPGVVRDMACRGFLVSNAVTCVRTVCAQAHACDLEITFCSTSARCSASVCVLAAPVCAASFAKVEKVVCAFWVASSSSSCLRVWSWVWLCRGLGRRGREQGKGRRR